MRVCTSAAISISCASRSASWLSRSRRTFTIAAAAIDATLRSSSISSRRNAYASPVYTRSTPTASSLYRIPMLSIETIPSLSLMPGYCTRSSSAMLATVSNPRGPSAARSIKLRLKLTFPLSKYSGLRLCTAAMTSSSFSSSTRRMLLAFISITSLTSRTVRSSTLRKSRLSASMWLTL